MSHYRVLIPTTNPARTGPLLKAVSPFLNAEDSRGTLLGVIEMAPERPLSEGVEVARAYRALLSRITRYAERGPGELFVIVGSSGYLEVSASQASAAKMLGCGVGAPVELRLL